MVYIFCIFVIINVFTNYRGKKKKKVSISKNVHTCKGRTTYSAFQGPVVKPLQGEGVLKPSTAPGSLIMRSTHA